MLIYYVPGMYNEYEIYDFTTYSWRVLGASSEWLFEKNCCGVSVKGNTYWVALAREWGPYPKGLLSFDFSTEICLSLCLLQPFP